MTTTPEPPHAVGALTTSELTDYKRRLERALGDKTISNAPVAATLRAKLAEVTEEEAERERHRNHGQRWPIRNLGEAPVSSPARRLDSSCAPRRRYAIVPVIVIHRQEVSPNERSIGSGCSPAVHDRATEVVATGSARQALRERRLS